MNVNDWSWLKSQPPRTKPVWLNKAEKTNPYPLFLPQTSPQMAGDHMLRNWWPLLVISTPETTELTHTYANLPLFWRICTTKDFPEMSDLRLLAAYIDPFLKTHWYRWNIIHLPNYNNTGISLNTESSLQRNAEIFQSTLHCHWFSQLSAHIIRSKPQPYIVKVLREF